MSTKRKTYRSIFMHLAIFAYYCVPVWVTLLSINLTSMYLAYYDIGFAGANNLGLILFIAPLLLLVMFGIIIGITRIAAYWGWPQWVGMILGTLLVLTVGIAAFLKQITDLADYPTWETQNMTTFLKHYFQSLGQQTGLIKSQ
jgi:hypothetical protein